MVTVRPESAFAEYFFGEPESREKELLGMTMLVVKAEPEILRQSVQWQIAWYLSEGWESRGGNMNGSEMTCLVGWLSRVGEGDFTAVAGSFAHCRVFFRVSLVVS